MQNAFYFHHHEKGLKGEGFRVTSSYTDEDLCQVMIGYCKRNSQVSKGGLSAGVKITRPSYPNPDLTRAIASRFSATKAEKERA